RLGAEDGFFKNELVKILLPQELRKVDAALRSFGLSSLADQGLLLLNRAAEDAVQEGIPIFANAITSITFDDAKNILLGDSVAATNYLKGKTSEQLFTRSEEHQSELQSRENLVCHLLLVKKTGDLNPASPS